MHAIMPRISLVSMTVVLLACNGDGRKDAGPRDEDGPTNPTDKDKDGNEDSLCDDGYRETDAGDCEDINECVENRPCQNSARCFDFDGGYQCDCLPGFQGDNCQKLTPHPFGLFTGTIAERETVAVPADMAWPRLVDLDGDGHIDILHWDIADAHKGLFVALGDGSGGFLPTQQYDGCEFGAYWPGTDADLGDFNGDGAVDVRCLARASNAYDQSLVLFDPIARGFASPVDSSISVNFLIDPVARVTIADANDDGRADLISGNDVILSASDGSIPSTAINEAFVPLSQEGAFVGASLVDLTGDGVPEALLQMGATMHVATSDGDGTFTDQGAIASLPNTDALSYVVTHGDFDGDGHTDVLMAQVGGASIPGVALFGDGVGDFTSSVLTSFTDLYTGIDAISARNSHFALDIDNDGTDELLAVSSEFGVVYNVDPTLGFEMGIARPVSHVLTSTEVGLEVTPSGEVALYKTHRGRDVVRIPVDPVFGLGGPDPILAVGSPAQTQELVAVADVDGDGFRDVIVRDPDDPSRPTTKVIYARKNFPAAGLEEPPYADTPPNLAQTANHVFFDIDNDRMIDHVGAYEDNDDLLVTIGVSGGAFADATLGGITTTFHRGPHIMDLDGEGFADILLGTQSETATWLTSESGVVEGPSSESASPLALGDFDNDGFHDFIGVTTVATLFLNDGTGQFTTTTPGIDLTLQSRPATADFNEDGFLDLLVPGPLNQDDPVMRYFGDGTGAFTASPLALTDPERRASAGASTGVGDLDGDGHVDVVISGMRAGSTLMVLLGDGNGGFTTHRYFGSSRQEPLLMGDFNRDGALDLAQSYIEPGPQASGAPGLHVTWGEL